jgi:hypothetical protein
MVGRNNDDGRDDENASADGGDDCDEWGHLLPTQIPFALLTPRMSSRLC